MLENAIPLTVKIPYFGKNYEYDEKFQPYSLGLIEELLQDSKLKSIVEYIVANQKTSFDGYSESFESDIDYFFDLFSVLKIVESRVIKESELSIKSYLRQLEQLQLDIIFEKIKLSLVPYYEILTERTVIDENVEKYFNYIENRIYNFSDEVNPFFNYDFKDENFNKLVKKIDLILEENAYETDDEIYKTRCKIEKALSSYINTPNSFAKKEKVEYAKLILLLPVQPYHPHFLDRYRIAICGARTNELERVVKRIKNKNTCAKRINNYFQKPLEITDRTNARIESDSEVIIEEYKEITQQVNPLFVKKHKSRCFGLLIPETKEKILYSLSGVSIDNDDNNTPKIITKIEEILKEKYPDISRKMISNNQITYYDNYQKNAQKGLSFENIKPLKSSITLGDFKTKHGISSIFTDSNHSYYRCFSCCEPKLLAKLNATDNQLTLYVKKQPCLNCSLIIPDYKVHLQNVCFYDESNEKIEFFKI